LSRFYISVEFFSFLMLTSFVLMFFTSFKAYTLWLLLLSFFLFLCRRKKISFKDYRRGPGNVILASINGQVRRVYYGIDFEPFGKANCIEVTVPYMYEWGVYMPFGGDVLDVTSKSSKRYFRYSDNFNWHESYTYLRLLLCSKDNRSVALDILPCYTGLKPRFWVGPGDRGQLASCLGYLPLGGSVLLYLDTSCNILVAENQILQAGQTPVAAYT